MGEVDPGFEGVRFFRGTGREHRGGTGYRGRVGMFEILEVEDEIKQMILDRSDARAIREVALERGMRTLFHDALTKVFLGETTVEELIRVSA